MLFRSTRRNDVIKVIAIVTMLIDHVGVLFFPQLRIFRTIGRIAFPIFAYQIAKGYSKTSDRKKYSLRLLIFAIIAQLPYMVLDYDLAPEYFKFNVIFLFLYSFLVLYLYELLKNAKKSYIQVLLVIPFLFSIILPRLMEMNYQSFTLSYGTYGILIILIFYIFDEKWITITVLYVTMSLLYTYQTGAFIYVTQYSNNGFGADMYFFEALKSFSAVYGGMDRYRVGLLKLD